MELHTISGTIDAGAAAGQRIYLNLIDAVTGRMTTRGTSLATGGAFEVRGVEAGRYIITAYADDLGFGRRRAHSLAAESDVIEVNADVNGVTMALEQLAEMKLHPPARLSAHPVDGGAALYWHGSSASALEAADSYNVYWSKDPNLSVTNYEGVRRDVGGQGVCSNKWHRGLENGESYYWIVTAQVGEQESAPSPVAGPVTIGALEGGGVASGTVYFEDGPPNSPIWVMVGTSDAFESYYTYIENPHAEQPYTITGLPEFGGAVELLELTVIVDVDADGIPSGPDYNVEVPIELPQDGSNVIRQDLVVGGAGAATRLRTNDWSGPGIEGSAVDLAVVQARKLPARVVVSTLSGAVDLGGVEREDINGRAFVYVGPPEPSYVVDVTYTDLTRDTLELVPPTERPAFPQIDSVDAEAVTWSAESGEVRVMVYRAGHAFEPFSTEEFLLSHGGVLVTEWTHANSVQFDQPLAPGDYMVAVERRDANDNRATSLLPLSL